MAQGIYARPLLVIAAALGLSGCVNFSPLDDLQTATPPSDPFSQALYKNYAFLAQSFGEVGQAQYGTFDQSASIPLADTDGNVASLANAYAEKALKLSHDELVDPEPSRDIKTHEQRDRLVRTIAIAHEAFPRDAARAQADWDCWRLNSSVAALAASAEQCRRSLEVTLPRLETEAAAVKVQQDAEKKKAAEAAEAAKKNAGAETPSSEMP